MIPAREPWRTLVAVLVVFGPLYLLASAGQSWAWALALAIFAMLVLTRYGQNLIVAARNGAASAASNAARLGK